MNPKIIAYLKAKGSLPAEYEDGPEVQDAQAGVDRANTIANVGNTGVALANALGNQPAIYRNSMQNLGKAPVVEQGQRLQADFSDIQKQAGDRLKTATADRDQMLQAMLEQRKQELAAGLQAKKDADAAEWKQKEFDQRERGITTNAALRQAMLGNKQAEQADKKAQAEAELNVPGYDRTGEVRQSPAEAKDARNAIGVANNMFKGLDLLQQQIDQNGSFEWGGAAGADMAATANDLRLQAKELYNLGVLNGPDLQLMLKQIPDTESVGALFTRDTTAKSQLRSTAAAMKRKVEEAMKAKGYAAKGEAPASGPNPGDVVDGYTFIGGDPSNPASWKK